MSDDPSSSGRLLVSCLHHLGHENKIQLVLASQSPRRKEILDMMGLLDKYSVQPSPLDESALSQELSQTKMTPVQYTQRLAQEKAMALAHELMKTTSDSVLILGSDTIVDLDGTVLEKPNNTNQALEMLQQLSGKWHKVHTGVAIYQVHEQTTKLMSAFCDSTQVKFASLSQNDIYAYVATKEPMDKAGSYGIQGMGGQLVQEIKGDFFTVMGLPMHRTSVELSRAIEEIVETRN